MITKTKILALFFLILEAYGFCQNSSPVEIAIKIIIKKHVLPEVEDPVFIMFESERIKRSSFQNLDSTFRFNFSNSDSITIPYTTLVIFYNKVLYEIPFDPLFTAASAFKEFQNIRKVSCLLLKPKRINRYFGFVYFSFGNNSVRTKEKCFYHTIKSSRYKAFKEFAVTKY